MDRSIEAMIQEKNSQHQPAATPSAQEGLRELYSEWAITALMGYAQVYKESTILIIWGKIQMAKECCENYK